jgi:predicted nucleic acid-binding protein
MFDVQIVATMLGNGIDRLYTFNLSDFVAFSEIRAVEPSA